MSCLKSSIKDWDEDDEYVDETRPPIEQLGRAEIDLRLRQFFRATFRIRAGTEIQCQECGADVLIRFRHADGRAFLGCSKYPACRSCIDIPDTLQQSARDWEHWKVSNHLSAIITEQTTKKETKMTTGATGATVRTSTSKRSATSSSKRGWPRAPTRFCHC